MYNFWPNATIWCAEIIIYILFLFIIGILIFALSFDMVETVLSYVVPYSAYFIFLL
jgi:hypothetical protein